MWCISRTDHLHCQGEMNLLVSLLHIPLLLNIDVYIYIYIYIYIKRNKDNKIKNRSKCVYKL